MIIFVIVNNYSIVKFNLLFVVQLLSSFQIYTTILNYVLVDLIAYTQSLDDLNNDFLFYPENC